MRKIYEIAKAELQTLFYSPVAWLIIVIFVFQISLIFSSVLDTMVTTTMMGYQNSALTMKIFANPMGNGLLFQVQNYLYLYIPLLTMGILTSPSLYPSEATPSTTSSFIFRQQPRNAGRASSVATLKMILLMRSLNSFFITLKERSFDTSLKTG